MKYSWRLVVAVFVCLVFRASGWAQQNPPRTSPIQKLIAADQLIEEKDYDSAIRAYTELLASQPHNAQILNRLGNTYQSLQKMKEARRYYEEAIKADPRFAAAVNNIGCIYYAERNYGKAAKQYRRAIKMDSSVASFQSNLGYAYLQEKKYKEMMVAFRNAVALDPTIFDPHTNRTGTIFLERSVANRAAVYFFLAKAYGQNADAVRCLEYLKKARDEHFKDILLVKTDPAFAPVRSNPAIKDFMDNLVPLPDPNPSSAAE